MGGMERGRWEPLEFQISEKITDKKFSFEVFQETFFWKKFRFLRKIIIRVLKKKIMIFQIFVKIPTPRIGIFAGSEI